MKLDSFFDIFSKYPETDKARNYSEAYETSFLGKREDVKLLFEIGVNNGGSVRGFKEFFPNAKIVGIEIDPRFYFEDERISVEIGSATDSNFINGLLEKHGLPDVTIDDGSHRSADIKETYRLLYDKTKTCYVIEDYGTQYKEFEGGGYITDGVPATNIAHNHVDDLFFNPSSKHINIYHSIFFMFK